MAASAGFAWLHNHLLNQQHAQQVQQQYQREVREQLHEEYHHQQHLEQDLQRIYRPHRNLGIGASWEDALHRFETYCRDAAFCYDLVQEMLAIAVMSIAEREAYYAECQGQVRRGCNCSGKARTDGLRKMDFLNSLMDHAIDLRSFL